ncbi:MAG: hypothetical protein ACT6UL_21450, partial [Sphingopyxis sp.]
TSIILSEKGVPLRRRSGVPFERRLTLCTTIYYLEWVRIGRQTGLKVDLRVNDVIDMQIAAVGTFFCGVFSLDKRLQGISQTARSILRQWGTYVGEDWSPALPQQSL